MENETIRLNNELKVHQIELEAQNDALKHLKEMAEVEAEKYLELYDSSTAGNITLSPKGEILELNLAAAELLGKERTTLKNNRFGFFISSDARPVFNLFFERVFNSLAKETCEVVLSLKGEKQLDVSLTGIVNAKSGNCLITMVDISERIYITKLSVTNKELLYQNDEKANRAAELLISNEAIAFQRDRLEKIASLVPGVVYQFRLRPDGSSCFPYASDAIQMVYRVTPEEVREDASKVFANLHPDDLDEVNATILQSAKDLSPWKQDYRTKFEDGTIRYLFGNSMPQLEADGSVLWHGFITDITERKQMEEDLKQSELRFRTLIEWTPNAVLIHGRMKIIYANPAAVTLFGATSLQELTGTSIWDRIDPYYHPIVRERITSGMDAPMMEVRYLKLDETVVEAEVRGTNIIYDGMPCLHASITDITQRKKEEEKLRNSHARLASMTANISDVIGIMGADGLMKYKSANIEKFFGWTPEERVGSSGYTTIHPDDLDRVQTIFLSLIGEENAVKTLEFRYECKDGSYKPIELTAANLLNDPVINGILLNYRDITERNTREGKINLQNEELHKLNTQKDKFFSIIAHDLRGPISGFMQLAELLADEEQAKTDSETSEMIADLSHSARNTFNLLENLLEWSQINSGNFNFNPKKIGLSSLVQECTAILAEQARAKEIGFTIEIANGLEVFADKDMLQTVVRNLLSNALKYSHKGGQVIILAKSVKENQTMVSVKDTGIGMTEAMKNNLFRIDANTKRRGTQGESSTGLGLQLCKEFVEIQGGKMSIESEQNVGSEFSFTIVSADPSQKKVESKKPVLDEIGKSTLKQLNVLIVEDDDITYSMLKRVVRNVSKEVYRAFSGAEAIEICHTMTDLDLILMDLRLPIMDGYEATRQIRMFNKEVVIIAQTAQASDKYKNIALDAGCNDYITKPVDNKRLMEMILYHCLAKE